jgi:hypothetical protein
MRFASHSDTARDANHPLPSEHLAAPLIDKAVFDMGLRKIV